MIEQIAYSFQWQTTAPASASFGCKVRLIASTFFKTICKVAAFPLRLLGSKTFSLPGIILRLPLVAIKHLFDKTATASSFYEKILCNKGYHWFAKSPITEDLARRYMPEATAVGCIHRNNPNWMAPFGYLPIKSDTFDTALEKDGAILFDRSTGLKILALEKGDEVMLVFGAYKSHESQFPNTQSNECKKLTRKSLASCVGSLLGGCPSLYTTADKTVQQIMKSGYLTNKKVTLCGLSLGASIASYVALKQQIPAIALNAFPLGPGLQKKIGSEKLQNADQIVTNIQTEGDFYGDWPWLVKISDCALNMLGIRTAGVFGKVISVPSIHKKQHNNHVDALGALAAKYKPEWKTICLDRYSQNDQTAYNSFKKLAALVAADFNPA